MRALQAVRPPNRLGGPALTSYTQPVDILDRIDAALEGTEVLSADELFGRAFARLHACPSYEIGSEARPWCWACTRTQTEARILNDVGLCRDCAIEIVPGLEHLEPFVVDIDEFTKRYGVFSEPFVQMVREVQRINLDPRDPCPGRGLVGMAAQIERWDAGLD